MAKASAKGEGSPCLWLFIWTMLLLSATAKVPPTLHSSDGVLQDWGQRVPWLHALVGCTFTSYEEDWM